MTTYKPNFTSKITIIVSFLGLATVGHTKECVESVDNTVLFRSGDVNSVGKRVVDFLAVIGNQDLANSKGMHLSNFSAIIHQDRANYQKSKRADIIGDIRDGDDRYFTTLDRRKTLSKAPFYYDCYMDKQGIIDLHNQVQSGSFAAVWVVLLRRPDGRLAVYARSVG